MCVGGEGKNIIGKVDCFELIGRLGFSTIRTDRTAVTLWHFVVADY